MIAVLKDNFQSVLEKNNKRKKKEKLKITKTKQNKSRNRSPVNEY